MKIVPMSKESTKTKKVSIKKPNFPSPNMDFESYLKNQQNIVAKLKTELKDVVSKVQLSDCGAAEKDKRILELEHSINQRDTEIHNLRVNVEQMKDENSKIMIDLHTFKEKFYQLEIYYDRSLNEKTEENENLMQQLHNRQKSENGEIQQLTLKCQELEQKLQAAMKDLTNLNKVHVETLQNLEEVKSNYYQQQKEFELYKTRENENKNLNEEKIKLDFEKVRDELKQKNELLEQCISDKNVLEKEKNLIIDELNNKIQRIERAFSQPTKVVQPLQINNIDNKSETEIIRSGANVTPSKPQVRKPSNENEKPENTDTQRNYKIKRPSQYQTSSQHTNVTEKLTSDRKRRNQPLRQSSAIKSYNEFSSSSSDEDNDNTSNYSTFSQLLWRPNNNCYVPDTDTSEGFAKSKRSKK